MIVPGLRREASTSRSRSWPSDQRLPAPARLGRQIALELLFGKWSAVAEDAGAGAIDHERAAARRVARRTRQRFRNGVADDGIGRATPARLRGPGRANATQRAIRVTDDATDPSQRLPP